MRSDTKKKLAKRGTTFDNDDGDPATDWPQAGEIDVMEHVGRKPQVTYGTIHGPGYAGAGSLGGWNTQNFDIADEFHTYAIEWDEEGIEWFFDGEPFYEIGPGDLGNREWVYDQPFFLIVNLALLLVGMVIDGIAAIILITPILLPIATGSYDISPYQFGVVVCLNLVLGLLTPPVGIGLYIASSMGGTSPGSILKSLWPFLIAVALVLVLLSYAPILSTYLIG